jgi:hypothetical protein
VKRRLARGVSLLTRGGALLRASLPIQDVGAGDLVFAKPHQGQFDVVLDVFNMKGATALLAARERADDRAGQAFDQLAHACRCCALPAVDGQKRLGEGDCDLSRFECNHRSIAADDFEIGQEGGRRSARRGFGSGRCALRQLRFRPGAFSDSLHVILLVVATTNALLRDALAVLFFGAQTDSGLPLS